MKEIIAERDKSFFRLITVVGGISLIAGIIALIFIPKFFWFYIFVISGMGLITLIGVIGLCFPNWVIIREEDAIIIQNGFRVFKKKKINITDIVEAKVQSLPQQIKEKQNGNIILKIRTESNEIKDILVIHIKNSIEVVKKLNLLIQNKIEPRKS